eukprot:jgi/Mesen1/8120/ME000436S07359
MLRNRQLERASSPGRSAHVKTYPPKPGDRRLLLSASLIFFLTIAVVCLRRTTSAHIRNLYGGRQELAQSRRSSTPLSDRASNVRLCPPDKERPFTTGTFFSRLLPVSAGEGKEHKLVQVTVFEAELLHLAWEDKPKVFGKLGSAGDVVPMVRLLAAVEDLESIHRSQFHGWGAAYMSPLYFSGDIQLECHFHPAPPRGGGSGGGGSQGDRDAGSNVLTEEGESGAPAFKSPAFFEKMGNNFHQFYVVLLCPAPVLPPHGAPEGAAGEGDGNGKSSSNHEGRVGATDAGGRKSWRRLLGGGGGGPGGRGSEQAEASDGVDRVLYEGRFEVQLAASLEGTDLRMSRLHLCRSDRASIPKPFEVLLNQAIFEDDGGTKGKQQGGVEDNNTLEPGTGTSQSHLPSFQVSGHGVLDTLHYLPRTRGGATRVLVDREEVQVAASEAARLASSMPRSRVEVGREFRMSLCVRPFSNARPFSPETGKPTFSDARIMEWIDAHLLAGFDHIYFFDRDHGKRQRLLLPYVRRGQLLHLPFPDWSEVGYRLSYKESSDPYNFPMIYEQVLVYELCPMLGRRYGDTWQFDSDLDEFTLTPHPEKGSLKHQLMRAVAAEEAARGNRIKMLSIKRYNFAGVTEATRLMPVLQYSKRCKHPLYQKDGWTGPKDKLAVNPSINIPL